MPCCGFCDGIISLPKHFFFAWLFTSLETKHNPDVDGLCFLQCETRGGHAGKLSLHNPTWQIIIHAKNLTFHNTNFSRSSFMFLTQYSIQRACDHPTTSASPNGIIKNMWGRSQAPSQNGVISIVLPLILHSPRVARLIPLEIHFTLTSRGGGKSLFWSENECTASPL